MNDDDSSYFPQYASSAAPDDDPAPAQQEEDWRASLPTQLDDNTQQYSIRDPSGSAAVQYDPSSGFNFPAQSHSQEPSVDGQLSTGSQPFSGGTMENTYLPPQSFYPVPAHGTPPTTLASSASSSGFMPSLSSSSLGGFSPNSISPAGQAQHSYFMPQGSSGQSSTGGQGPMEGFYPVTGSETYGNLGGADSDGIAQYLDLSPETTQHPPSHFTHHFSQSSLGALPFEPMAPVPTAPNYLPQGAPVAPQGTHYSHLPGNIPNPPQIPLDIPPLSPVIVPLPAQPQRVAVPAAGSRAHGGARVKESVRYSPVGLHTPTPAHPRVAVSGQGMCPRPPPPHHQEAQQLGASSATFPPPAPPAFQQHPHHLQQQRPSPQAVYASQHTTPSPPPLPGSSKLQHPSMVGTIDQPSQFYPTPQQLHEIIRRQQLAHRGRAPSPAVDTTSLGMTYPPHGLLPDSLSASSHPLPSFTPSSSPPASLTSLLIPPPPPPPSPHPSTVWGTAGVANLPHRPSPLRTSSGSFESSTSSQLLFGVNDIVGWDGGLPHTGQDTAPQYAYHPPPQDVSSGQQRHLPETQSPSQNAGVRCSVSSTPSNAVLSSASSSIGASQAASSNPPREQMQRPGVQVTRTRKPASSSGTVTAVRQILPRPADVSTPPQAQQDFRLANDHPAAELYQPPVPVPRPPDRPAVIAANVSAQRQPSPSVIQNTSTDPPRSLTRPTPPFPISTDTPLDLPHLPEAVPRAVPPRLRPGSYLASLLKYIPNEQLRLAVESKQIPERIRKLVSPSLQHILLDTVFASATYKELFDAAGDRAAFLARMMTGDNGRDSRWSEALHLAMLALGSHLLAEMPENAKRQWAVVTDMFIPYAVRTLLESTMPWWDWAKERAFSILITLLVDHKEYGDLTSILKAYKDSYLTGIPFTLDSVSDRSSLLCPSTRPSTPDSERNYTEWSLLSPDSDGRRDRCEGPQANNIRTGIGGWKTRVKEPAPKRKPDRSNGSKRKSKEVERAVSGSPMYSTTLEQIDRDRVQSEVRHGMSAGASGSEV